MSSSRKRRRKSRSSSPFTVKKKRSALRTVIETAMGVSIGALILAGIIWFYFIREAPDEVSNSESTSGVVENNIVAREASYEAIRDNGSLEDQMDLLIQLNSLPKGAQTPVILDSLAKRLELAQLVLANPEIKESDRAIAARAAVRASSQIYGISIDEGISTEGKIKDDYNRIISKYLNDKDAVVSKEAKLSEVKLLVYDNLFKDLPGAFSVIQRELMSLIDDMPSDMSVLSTANVLAERIKVEDASLGNKLFAAILEKYKSFPNLDDKLLPRLKSIEDQITIGGAEIGVLTAEIASTEKFEDYFNNLGKLIDQPGTGINFVNRLYSVVSYLEAVGEYDNAIRVLERIKESVPSRTDRNAQIQADRIARFGLIRNSVVGKKFDFSDTQISGLPVEIDIMKKCPVILAFYSPNNPKSENLLVELNQSYLNLASTGVKVITIAVEAPSDGQIGQGFNPEWVKILSIPPTGPQDTDEKLSQIFKRMPVSHVPYFALVDSDGVVRDINVPLDQIKTKVEAMESAAR